jgi:hypothetical protein
VKRRAALAIPAALGLLALGATTAFVAVPRIRKARERAALRRKVEGLRSHLLEVYDHEALLSLRKIDTPEALVALADLARAKNRWTAWLAGRSLADALARIIDGKRALDGDERRSIEALAVDPDPTRRFLGLYLLDSSTPIAKVPGGDPRQIDLELIAWQLPERLEILESAFVTWPDGEPRVRAGDWVERLPRDRVLRATAALNGLEVLSRRDAATGLTILVVNDPSRAGEAAERGDALLARLREAADRMRGVDAKTLLAARLRAILKLQREVLEETKSLRGP